MADVHKNTKYSVSSRLNDHDAQLLELRNLIKSTLLSPGPQGTQGQTGASGADGRNGLHGKDGAAGRDSCVPGPQGTVGLQGHRGERGIKGETGDTGAPGKDGKDGCSITGPQGAKGDRGDVSIVGDAELKAAVLKLKKRHAALLGRIKYEQELNNKQPHSGLKKALEAILNTIAREEA